MNIVRLPYNGGFNGNHIYDADTLIVKNRLGNERRIPPAKWWINKRTPVGEDAELWERMPHSGRRQIYLDEVVALERVVEPK